MGILKMKTINLEELFEYEYIKDTALKFENPSFDNSIVGISDEGRLIYDYDNMVQELMLKDNMNELEAMEFIDYNTIRSLPYYGSNAPIIMMEHLEVN